MDIKAYDKQQILNYMSANGITGMVRDTVGGDTSGIYYQVINPGDPTKQIDYPDAISFVYAIKSFDNKFVADDTVANHYYGYAGHITPNGLMIGIHNDLKYKGAKVRFLIPSHLAYGTNGAGSGSKTITTGRIAGNQCLDYTVNLINNQQLYDDMVINNYMAANALTGYIKTESTVMPGNYYYYKITTPGTGTAKIDYNSSIYAQYNGRLLNGQVFDSNVTAAGALLQAPDLTTGAFETLEHATVGTVISVIIPSTLAFGTVGGSAAVVIPANACVRFEFTVISVTP